MRKNSSLTSSQPEVQKNCQQLIKNFQRLPCPKFQIIQIYENYIYVRGIKDKDQKLKNKILEINELALIQQFSSFMYLVFNDLETEFKNIKFESNLSKLDQIVDKCLSKMFKQNYVSSSKIMNKPKSKSKIFVEQTKGNQKMQIEQIPLNDQKKVQLILGELFFKLHASISDYKNHYHYQHAEFLQKAIYENFYSYSQQKSFSFLNIKQNKECFIGKGSEKSIPFEAQQSKPNQQKKSAFMDQLMDIVVQDMEDQKAIKKIDQQNENKRKSMINGLKVGGYEINPLQIFGNAYSLFQNLYEKSVPKAITHKLLEMRSNNITNSLKHEMTEEQQKAAYLLAQVFLKTHARHNISKEYGLNADQFRLIQEYISSAKYEGFLMLNYRFSSEEHVLIFQTLSDIATDLSKDINQQKNAKKLQRFIDNFFNIILTQEKQKESLKIMNKKGIKTTLSTINTLSQLPNTFYLIVVLLKQFQKQYNPSIRRLLIRIGHQIEDKYKQMYQTKQIEYRKFSLTHVIKLLQSQRVDRSNLSKLVTTQKPFRESQLPLRHEKQEYFQDSPTNKNSSISETQTQVQLELSRIHIIELKKFHKQPSKMELLKLSHSTFKKNVTVLISGFLSEDTNKFEEWMGILEPTYDSQIYALKWQSKTMQHILQYTIKSCKDLAYAGAGIGLIGGPYIKAAMIIKQIVSKFNDNPFNPCFEIATVTGIFFAELMMTLFDGHFINFIGFSLGTQVICSALRQFKKKGKLVMINRIITMGGVADKQQMLQLLDSVEQNSLNPISIAWTNIYCQTDNILKYLLRVCMPSLDPIGLSQAVPQHQKGSISAIKTSKVYQKVYSVDNIDVTSFVKGHLSYRQNMKTIARLIGIKDQ